MKNKILLFLIFIISGILQAQDKQDSSRNIPAFEAGLRIEINKVKEERLTLGAQPQYQTSFKVYGEYVFPYSLYVPLKYNVDKKWSAEFRPGILFSGEHLTSAVFGFHCYYYPFEERVYTLIGLENSKRINPYTFDATGETWNTYYQRVTSHNDDEWHTAVIFGAGYELGSVVSVDLSMTLPFQQQYGWHDIKDKYNSIDLPDGRYPMKLFYMIKFGVNILMF